MSEYEFYRLEKSHPVAWVYLNRPDKRNAMNPPAWTETIPIFEDIGADPEVRVVILTGEGPCFSAGIDLPSMASELPELMDPNQLGGVKWRLMNKIRDMQRTMTVIERCPVPVIAAVHGHCIGAGLDMIAAADIRLATADASFCLKEAAIGIVADVGGLQRLPAIIGEGYTRELAYTARSIDAERAREIGLVNRVFEDREALLEGASVMAQEIADNSPLAVRACKEVLGAALRGSVDAGLDHVASVSANIIPSGDLMEAMAAFAGQRKPVFKGE